MFKKLIVLAVGLVWLGSFSACLLDPKEKPEDEKKGPPPVSFEDLTERWHVLNNIEASYLQRNSTEYNRLIDPDDYVFFFSAEDFANGRTPEQWGPEQDVPATENLFRLASNIDLEVQFNKDQLQWTAINPTNFPNETWFQATVPYSFSMRFTDDPETVFQTSGTPQTSFTVRQYDDDGTMRWRLVEWRDIGNS